MMHITGAAVIQLIIADQIRAQIGLIFVKSSSSPIKVAAAKTVERFCFFCFALQAYQPS
jgi:hypothetical protein